MDSEKNKSYIKNKGETLNSVVSGAMCFLTTEKKNISIRRTDLSGLTLEDHNLLKDGNLWKDLWIIKELKIE